MRKIPDADHPAELLMIFGECRFQTAIFRSQESVQLAKKLRRLV